MFKINKITVIVIEIIIDLDFILETVYLKIEFENWDVFWFINNSCNSNFIYSNFIYVGFIS